MWLVGEGGIYGCGCKEVYRFPHTTYPYSSCICSFLQQHPTFCLFFYIMVNFPLKGNVIVKVINLEKVTNKNEHVNIILRQFKFNVRTYLACTVKPA